MTSEEQGKLIQPGKLHESGGARDLEVEISFTADKQSWLGNYRLLRNLQKAVLVEQSRVDHVAIISEGTKHLYPLDGLTALLKEFLIFSGLEDDLHEIEST